ncbi:MAG: bifunctional DNA-binding transcriptional regulator/O6-methylguanine-DNA methyltransferase Ada [Betaproteobacteria bacterium]|jgi:AraC family transcriptional regulator of adaptative response/methylated-DNA-[protein]-cysteine methyltransferase|nr:bifunctional DNA-binding transcriptional regulator/O6-methylguanine-DNA methyltransferase Ada [Betaproteobacteria bacterium]MBK7080146.1 bifunctional DNA-binding transcriptional regulator/O6-methylguanine-DNA methyltransferase Ada [Betaproteobacteria bacterium]MBK7743188.1 bifunctional DNA-binding transcriptional regulator/O6-methylguanine-DNA methyltransferase Ada [Betaproteobacteria bacterium]MBK8687869.1 bifunctional DNA-binding transcriptional regulator/O6-methylguanine-DNA methyltransfer
MKATAPRIEPLPATPDRRAAVEHRDAAADGRFVFAVRTTGIYCRPSCPSRRARPENVLFFACCADAERAGFRACRRCQPRRETSDATLVAAVADACRRLDAAAGEGRRLDLAELARVAGYGKAHFHRAFRQRTGLTPRGYAEAARYRRLRDALAAGAPVLGAIADAGFSSPSRAYAAAARQLGTTPAAFRDRVRADGIRYATRATTLGWVLVAATPDGVCAVVLGDSRRALEDEFEARQPQARKAARDPRIAAWLRRVVDFVADPATPLQLPLDVAGTAFQHRVWRALLALPPGTTTSYGALAATLGAPRAVRAVAGACAANPAALVIPCHRVVAKDGGMAGYRWGVERKARLQERERAATAGAGGPGGKASQRAGR